MSKQGACVMKIKTQFVIRADNNRRDETASIPRFPMKIETGEVVLRERRVTPDRRRPGLQTHELQMTSEEFDQLFDAYQQHK